MILEIIVAFFASYGIISLGMSIFCRLDKNYKNRYRGTYIYIPMLSEHPDSIVSSLKENVESSLFERGRIIVIVRSERERNEVINDLANTFGTIYKLDNSNTN